MNHFQLYIGKDDTIGEVQHRFSDLFPHLSISLFKHTGDISCLSYQDILFSPETKMSEINPDLREGKLTIDPHMTVATFESVFFNQFGLFVQVCRNDGRPEPGNFGIDRCALEEANRTKQKENPLKEIILFRDVPYGC